MEEKRKQNKMSDFVALPRKIRDDYIDGKLTNNEYLVLVWIFHNTNPYNGRYHVNYKMLAECLKNTISYESIRKIISNLRKSQHIHFDNHKGRKGLFAIYPLNFLLTNKEIQTMQYLLSNKPGDTDTPSPSTARTDASQTKEVSNHNFQIEKGKLANSLSADRKCSPFTTSYNDNEIENNSDTDKIVNESSKRIDPNTFVPKTKEEEICLQVARHLEEIDMRFCLSCLKKYGYERMLKACEYMEKLPEGHIKNPRKYFNKLIKEL